MSEVVQKSGPVEKIETHKTKGENDAGDGVDLADADRMTLAEVLEVSVLTVSEETVHEQHPTTVARPLRRLLQQHSQPIAVCSGQSRALRVVVTRSHRRVVVTILLRTTVLS